MRHLLTEVRYSYCLHHAFNPLMNKSSRPAPYSQCPGDIIFDNGGNDLVVGILKDDAHTLTNSPLFESIPGIDT